MTIDQIRDPFVGRHIGGCRVEERIGMGGMGTVYRGVQEVLERQVAVKVLAPHLSREPRFRESFAREARVLARVNHPNIAQIHAVAQDGANLLLVLELVEGESLASFVAREGACSPIDAARIVLQAAQGLEAASLRGLVHRDIKPSNLMITAAGIVKVVDFGIATEINPQTGQSSGATSGSPVYRSPEQALGRPVDERADVYSLGATFWFLLMGRPPHDKEQYGALLREHGAAPPPLLPAEIPEPLRRLVEKMTAPDRRDRPDSARAVAESLEEWLEHAPPVNWALVADPDPERGSRRGRALQRLGLVAVNTTSGDDALASLTTRGTPAILLTTLSLPGVDGFGLVRALRSQAGERRTHVIVTSAFDELRHRAEAQRVALGLDVVVPMNVHDIWVEAAGRALLAGEPVPPAPISKSQGSDTAGRTQPTTPADLCFDSGATPSAGFLEMDAQVAAVLGVPVSQVATLLPDRLYVYERDGADDEPRTSRSFVKWDDEVLVPDDTGRLLSLDHTGPGVRLHTDMGDSLL